MARDKISQFVSNFFKKNYPKKNFLPGKSSVPVSGKIFNEKELEYGVKAVLEGWWTEGSWNQKLEEEIAKYLGVKFCSTVNSGSSANLVAFAALTSHLLEGKRIKPGDEIITAACGFPTTINPIVLYGCIPVFVDMDLKTMEIDVSQLEKAYSPKVKAVFIAHTLGNPFNIKAVKNFCNKYNLWLIEDNCDALGSQYDGAKTGSFGDISTLSFYPAHHITTAEGGAVLTNNPLLNKIVRSIRDWGRDCWCPTGKDNTCKNRFNWQLGALPYGYDHKYIYSHIGYNLKMTDLQAAIGVAQLEKLEKFTKQRQKNYNKLLSVLSSFSKYFDFPQATESSIPSWFGFILTLKEKTPFSRKNILEYLSDKGIGSRLLFGGNIIKQPYFINNRIKFRTINNLTNTDLIMDRTFWIGVYPGIDNKMISYVHNIFSEFIKQYE